MSPPKDSRPDNYEMNAKICRLVEQCPFMYDRSHPQYLRKEICDEAWIRIAKEMGESVFPCRERWRNIRTSFARSINTNKVPSSANRTKPYYLHEELKFLARHITPGVPVRNRKRATSSGSGDESGEHIEISVGEETFNGFEHFGENTSDTQNGQETSWQRLQHLPPNLNDGENHGDAATGGVGENDSCHSSTNGRFTSLPPPPLQAAPQQRGNDETEAAAVLQQIHMATVSAGAPLCPPLSKRPRKADEMTTTTAMSNEDATGLIVTEADRSCRESYVDIGLLQELQTEMANMSHRQRIHLKRRIYEALSEIYPLTCTPRNSIDATACNQLTLAALLRVENLCRNLNHKSESTANTTNVVPSVTVTGNATTTPCISENSANASASVQVPANDSLPPSLPPPKRNGMRTRSRPTERLKTNTVTPNGIPVKDEPEIND